MIVAYRINDMLFRVMIDVRCNAPSYPEGGCV